jgi:hypothetical protein
MVGRAVAALQRRSQRQVSKPHGHRVGRSGARKQQRRKSAHAQEANTAAQPLPSLCWIFIASAENPPGDWLRVESPGEERMQEAKALRDEYTRTIEPARALAAETLTLERTLSDLVNQAYALTPAEINLIWQTAPPRMPIPPPLS